MDKSELKILIIEDDLIIAENLKENLYDMGYRRVYHGANSDEGINLYNQYNPDICLVDIQLNGSKLDGIGMVEKHEMGTNIPIIYLTSFADTEIRNRAKKTHPSGYLLKPSNKTQIDVAIDIALSTFYRSTSKDVFPKCPLHSGNGFIFLKIKNKDYERYEKFYLKDISYIKAEGSYAHVYVGSKAPLVSMNLNKTLEVLNYPDLIRCHRSYAVNIEHVHSVDQSSFYVLNNDEVIHIPIGDLYKGEVNGRLQKM